MNPCKENNYNLTPCDYFYGGIREAKCTQLLQSMQMTSGYASRQKLTFYEKSKEEHEKKSKGLRKQEWRSREGRGQ